MALLQTNEIFKQQLSQKKHRMTEEETKAVQKIVLEIACDVVQICDEMDIPYMLGGGSALGGVRHRGFIPWDDDMDLNIPRRYINELLNAIEERYPDKYEVEAPIRTPGYLSSFIQIHRKGTIYREYLAQDIRHCGIKLDIFVIENTYNQPLKRIWHGARVELGLLMLSCYRMYLWKDEFLALTEGNKKARMAVRVKGLLGKLFALNGDSRYTRVQNCMMECRDENSRYIVIPSGRKHFFGELYPRLEYLSCEKMPFEHVDFLVTKDYDNYLKNLYGAYQEIPPKEKQEHHVLYQLQIKAAEEQQ